VKRTPHTRSTIFALSVPIIALLAVAGPARAAIAFLPPASVAADTGATVPPAASDSVAATPPSPVPAVEPAPEPVPVPTPAPPPAPAKLTKKQVRAQEKQAKVAAERAKADADREKSAARKKAKAEERAAKAAQAPKQAKVADVDSLAAWNAGVSWLMVRGGFAKSGETGASGGAAGAALGYQRFLTARWAIGLIAQGDLLGKFQGAAEIEYPITLELTRHFRWKTPLRPFLGFGGGAYYHKFFRSGNDVATLHSGLYLGGGFNTPIGKRSILGIDGRMQFVHGDRLVTNPVFGDEGGQLVHYSLKLGWSLAI